jgi:hypothetical protein
VALEYTGFKQLGKGVFYLARGARRSAPFLRAANFAFSRGHFTNAAIAATWSPVVSPYQQDFFAGGVTLWDFIPYVGTGMDVYEAFTC